MTNSAFGSASRQKGLPTGLGHSGNHSLGSKLTEGNPGHLETTKITTATTGDFTAIHHAGRACVTREHRQRFVIFFLLEFVTQFRVFVYGALFPVIALYPTFLRHVGGNLPFLTNFQVENQQFGICESIKRSHIGVIMKPSLFALSLVAFVTATIFSSNLRSQDNGADSDSGEQEKEWLEYYYENPTPERFVAQMKDWAEDGTLANEHARPALIAFISQLIRQNEEKLEGWFHDLAGLAPEEKQVFYTGMLFSRTKEADKLLREMYGETYDEQKTETPKILDLPLDKPQTLDMLWGFYYATGSEHAIRRIVLCFRFKEAPNQPEGVDVPKGFNPLYKELPYVAANSLIANAERHPKVRKLVELFYKEDDTLVPAERKGLYDVMSELDPENYPAKTGDEKEAKEEETASAQDAPAEKK